MPCRKRSGAMNALVPTGFGRVFSDTLETVRVVNDDLILERPKSVILAR